METRGTIMTSEEYVLRRLDELDVTNKELSRQLLSLSSENGYLKGKLTMLTEHFNEACNNVRLYKEELDAIKLGGKVV